jgi:hypothetical protein
MKAIPTGPIAIPAMSRLSAVSSGRADASPSLARSPPDKQGKRDSRGNAGDKAKARLTEDRADGKTRNRSDSEKYPAPDLPFVPLFRHGCAYGIAMHGCHVAMANKIFTSFFRDSERHFA